jgi:hypothetical protein
LNLTLSAQLAPARMDCGQLFFTAKSVEPVTDAEFTLNTAGAARVLETVSVAAALATPASGLPKLIDGGRIVAAA